LNANQTWLLTDVQNRETKNQFRESDVLAKAILNRMMRESGCMMAGDKKQGKRMGIMHMMMDQMMQHMEMMEGMPNK
jgi:hypothetical protein